MKETSLVCRDLVLTCCCPSSVEKINSCSRPRGTIKQPHSWSAEWESTLSTTLMKKRGVESGSVKTSRSSLRPGDRDRRIFDVALHQSTCWKERTKQRKREKVCRGSQSKRQREIDRKRKKRVRTKESRQKQQRKEKEEERTTTHIPITGERAKQQKLLAVHSFVFSQSQSVIDFLKREQNAGFFLSFGDRSKWMLHYGGFRFHFFSFLSWL